jgi:hypothetical protein
MRHILLPKATLSLLINVLLVSACARVPYGDQLPVTPQIPKDSDITNTPTPTTLSDCPVLNTDPANTTVVYSNPDKKISFTVPYNNQWGYTNAPVSPYSERAGDSDSLGYVLFGPPTSGDVEGLGTSCDPIQFYSLSFLPSRSADIAVRTIESRGTEVVPNTKVVTINGLTVVEFTDAGLCSYPTLEVVGQQYNYSGGDETEEWKYLENIVKSVQLTK